jgi:histidine triad (HIT) family protein
MNDCIFCKIVSGDIPCAKVWEDENFLAFLDIKPIMKGMTLIMPKKHHDSYIFNEEDSTILELMKAGKKVAKKLESALGVSRVALVVEGAAVNHLHLKLYPLHGFKGDFNFSSQEKTPFFEKYEGYLLTQEGPKANLQELSELAEKIRTCE